MGYNEGQNLLRNQTWRLDNTICLHDTHTHTHIYSLSHTHTHTQTLTHKNAHTHTYTCYTVVAGNDCEHIRTNIIHTNEKKIFVFYGCKGFFMFSNMLLTHFSSFVSFFFIQVIQIDPIILLVFGW